MTPETRHLREQVEAIEAELTQARADLAAERERPSALWFVWDTSEEGSYIVEGATEADAWIAGSDVLGLEPGEEYDPIEYGIRLVTVDDIEEMRERGAVKVPVRVGSFFDMGPTPEPADALEAAVDEMERRS